MLREEGNIRRGLDWKSNYFMRNGRIFMDNMLNPLSTVNDSRTHCLSCNRGPGISMAHDHNMMGMVSAGIYPHGPMTIFDIRPTSMKLEDE